MEPATDIPAPARAVTPVAATPVHYTEAELAGVQYNADGLVGAIVQEQGTGQVLMFAWMNEAALRRTLETGRMWYWSRSRQEYWCKGETSGDRQYVREAFYDCDVDALLFVWSRKAGVPATPANAAASSGPSGAGPPPAPSDAQP